ncbi:MAG: sodium/solute symporter [Chitinivibrionales bacterium]|nr:sodium/solute symporter [Chitinivibrionales bacterium]
MSSQIVITSVDLIVLFTYIIALVGLGFWISFKEKNSGDLFLAGRSMKWPSIGFSIWATNIGPTFLIGSCGIAYKAGMQGANFEWMAWIFLMLLAMLFAPHYLNAKIGTLPQFIKRRFGKKSYIFFTGLSCFNIFVFALGSTLYAGALLFSQMLGWPLWVSVVFLMLISASFTIAGGLLAVMITDSFQSVLMIIGMSTLLFIVFGHVGGADKLINGVPPEFWHMMARGEDAEFPWYAMVLGYPVLAIRFWCADQSWAVQRAMSAKNLKEAQLGCLFAGFLKILPPFIFMVPGIMARVLHPNLESSDEAFLVLVTNYLPVGMTGVVLGVLIAALVSTVDSLLNSGSTIFTLDIYAKYIKPDASSAQVKRAGRIVTSIAAVVACFFAVWLQGVGKDLFNLGQTMIAYIAPPTSAVFLIGILWKRATGKAAFSTFVIGTATSFVVGFLDFNKMLPENRPHYLLVSFYLFSAWCVLMVVVSLLTKKDSGEEDPPTLQETRKAHGKQQRRIWTLWGVLAVIMVVLYVIFN